MKHSTTLFAMIKYTYDEKGHLVKRSHYDGPNDTLDYEVYFEYDANENCIKTRYSTHNQEIQDVYDDNNRLISKFINNGDKKTVIHYKYDDKGLLIKDIMDHDVITEYTYNDNGKMTNLKCSDGCHESYEYDEKNNMTCRINHASGTVINITNEYDNKGRLVGCSYDDKYNKVIKFIYDEYDRVVRTTVISDCERESTNIEYDIFGNIITKIILVDNSRITLITYTYDNDNKLIDEKWVSNGTGESDANLNSVEE